MNTLHFSSFKATRAAVVMFAAAALTACAVAPTVPSAARSELAPAGKLRVGLLTTNPAFVSKDGAPEEMQGVGVEIGRELAKQLGVAFEPVRYRNVAELVAGAKSGQWDVAPIGMSPERTAVVDFTAPYLFGPSRYLVPIGSPIKTVEEIDKAGQRIVVSPRSVQDAYLAGNLRHAQIMRMTGAISLLASGKADAWFTTGVVANDWAAKRPEFRVVDGSVATGGAALAVPKGRPAGATYAKEFIEYVKASGLVQRVIEETGLEGVSVAPRASAD